jgi:hypothetical protein
MSKRGYKIDVRNTEDGGRMRVGAVYLCDETIRGIFYIPIHRLYMLRLSKVIMRMFVSNIKYESHSSFLTNLHKFSKLITNFLRCFFMILREYVYISFSESCDFQFLHFLSQRRNLLSCSHLMIPCGSDHVFFCQVMQVLACLLFFFGDYLR